MKILKVVIHFGAWLPLIWLAYAAYSRQLGGDPQEAVLHELGLFGLIFLLLSLSMTPAKMFYKSFAWVRFRRMLGLYGAFYLSLHLLVYLAFYLHFDFAELAAEIIKRPYITVGMVAFFLLLPLVVTSTRAAQRRLGKRWKKLHQLAYIITVLGLVHFIWQSKSDLNEPMLYVLWAGLLFGARWFKKHQNINIAKVSKPDNS
ncbi:sulfite oxidase heme-binding subunit YedZ [Aliikangiella coralliicola]|uniref:Protein-methionine-sulfoxide reductase heme-binding subunit MsrQ n=1 Tax=Aliikangiella coralliicola TaxID=2592383 RepID=A0A545TWI8_9GAMM|nr:protein-methionine-sulfoxide reductase heme-binding subunit MsrQ [Aliikangiella coralliicola]TQV81579.1 sulfoxide reductase heme-binding subunit YedZ [Aliikangiella coralliicola]